MELFDCLPDAACVIDKNGLITRANNHFFKNIAKQERTVGQIMMEDIIHTSDREKLQKGMFETLSKKFRSVIGRCRTLTFEGEHEFPVFRQYDWVLSPGIEASTVIASGRIVSARERIEADVESEQELLDFFQNAPIALHWLSDKGTIMWANNTELQTLGYTAEEYIGQQVMKFCPDDEALVLEIFKQLGTGNTIKDVPVRFRAKNGNIKYLLIDSNVNYNVDGSFRHTRCFIRDDTGRIVRDAVSRYEKDIAALQAKQRDRFHQSLLKEMTEYMQNMATGNVQANDQIKNISTFLQHLSHIEAGEVIILSPVQTDLLSLLTDFVTRNKAHHNVELRSHNLPSLVSMDHSLITLVLQPILNFIVECADNSKAVDFCVFHATTYFTFKFEFVTRTALDTEHINKIFHNCYSDATSSKASVNLGLFVASNIIQSLNCFLEFYADELDGVFQFNLPLKVIVAPTLMNASGDWPVKTKSFPTWSIMERSLAIASHFTIDTQNSSHTDSHDSLDVDSVSLSFAEEEPESSMTEEQFAMTKKMQSMMVGKFSGAEKGTTIESLADVVRQENSAHGVNFLGLENGRKRRILVVDDSSICTSMLSRSLLKVGYAVDIANNGKEALALLEIVPCMFDAVIMDVIMPIMNGIDATRAIRTKLNLTTLPIIVLTADVGKDTQNDSMAAGASEFLLKPVYTKAIVKLLHKRGLFAQVPDDA